MNIYKNKNFVTFLCDSFFRLTSKAIILIKWQKVQYFFHIGCFVWFSRRIFNNCLKQVFGNAVQSSFISKILFSFKFTKQLQEIEITLNSVHKFTVPQSSYGSKPLQIGKSKEDLKNQQWSSVYVTKIH